MKLTKHRAEFHQLRRLKIRYYNGELGREELEEHGILIVGMGGLGCPVAQYLISSGIGYLTIMDPDKVELSNLSRQPLYTEKDFGSY